MKRIFLCFLLASGLVAGSAAVASVDDGVNAYNRGDFGTAFEVFATLAERGDPIAQFNLGAMYANGRGVGRDLVKGYLWTQKAMNNMQPGSPRNHVARALNAMEARMSADELRRARAGNVDLGITLNKTPVPPPPQIAAAPDKPAREKPAARPPRRQAETAPLARERPEPRPDKSVEHTEDREMAALPSDPVMAEPLPDGDSPPARTRPQQRRSAKPPAGQTPSGEAPSGEAPTRPVDRAPDAPDAAARDRSAATTTPDSPATPANRAEPATPPEAATRPKAASPVEPSEQASPPSPARPSAPRRPAPEEKLVTDQAEADLMLAYEDEPSIGLALDYQPPNTGRGSSAAAALPGPAGPGGAYTVQLGSFKSAGQAQRHLDQVSSAHAALFGDIASDIHEADLGDKGTYYRVWVGEFASRRTASDLCQRLQDAGADCFVARK